MTTPDLTRDLEPAARFLLDRLEEFERADFDDEDWYREFSGHVSPAIARFRASLSEPAAPAGAEVVAVKALAHELGRVYWAAHHDRIDSNVVDAMAKAALAFRLATPQPVEPPDDRTEPVAWRVLVNENGRIWYVYTERLPYTHDDHIKVLRDPEPLYTAAPPPDDSLNDIAAGNEALAWIDMRNEPAADWTKRVIATNPEYVAANGAENFLPLGILVASKR
jgi:hypothetical protein